MCEFSADVPKVVLVFEFEGGKFKILRNVFGHLSSFDELLHLVLIDETNKTRNTVSITPYFSFDDLVFMVRL